MSNNNETNIMNDDIIIFQEMLIQLRQSQQQLQAEGARPRCRAPDLAIRVYI